MEAAKSSRIATLLVPDSLEIDDTLPDEGAKLVADQLMPKAVVPKPCLLEDFLAIRSRQEVLQFARRWGILGICDSHGTPACRERLRSGSPCLPEQSPTGPTMTGPVWREPIGMWMDLVRKANAMRRIGEAIQTGGAGSEADWRAVIVPENRSRETHRALFATFQKETGIDHLGMPWKSRKSARIKFSWIMQSWLVLGDIRPCFVWIQERWAIRSSVPQGGMFPLFGHLALYLSMAVAAGRESALCSFCRQEYFPQRRPTPGQMNCCGNPDCKRGYWRENKRLKATKLRDESTL